ncbi:linear amide C-N hydrolase [Pectobacteriaceae bacterium C52]|nr:linear amide C-N hydrolase [Pectobacteriaceae bacterium C52]
MTYSSDSVLTVFDGSKPNKRIHTMCLDFLINKNGNEYAVNGRSMEFADELGSRLFFRKAGYQYHSTARLERCQFSWIGKYSFVSMNAFNLDVAVDGMNTDGLSGGMLWLPGSEYPENINPANTISSVDFLQWMLSSFSRCNEVISALGRNVSDGADLHTFFEYEPLPGTQPQVNVSKISYKDLGISDSNDFFPLHYSINDATGHSIVIEFIAGKMHIYNNPVHVCTNVPEFPVHLQNLRNYVNLQKTNITTASFNSYVVEATGNGTGLLGMPGDLTPPSRFVRAVAITSFADQPVSSDEAMNLAFHILNTTDIPKGVLKEPGEQGAEDYTQWVVSKDLINNVYAIRYYDSPQVTAVRLDDLDWEALDGKCYKPVSSVYHTISNSELGK